MFMRFVKSIAYHKWFFEKKSKMTIEAKMNKNQLVNFLIAEGIELEEDISKVTMEIKVEE